MRPYLTALSLLSAALSGCGPNFSGEHFAVIQGAGGANAPNASPSGPFGARAESIGRPDLRPPPPGLPALTAAYRQNLLEMAHPFPAELAQHYADVEVRSLQSQYAGRELELEQELVRRLTASHALSDLPWRLQRQPLPGAYPAEEQSSLSEESVR